MATHRKGNTMTPRGPYIPKPKNPEMAWTQFAACRGMVTNSFYPEERAGKVTIDHMHARNNCSRCLVVDECLTYAIENKEQHGTWGGLPTQARRRLARLPVEDRITEAQRLRTRWDNRWGQQPTGTPTLFDRIDR
jgi:WhiB family redox-sensing transcriptional regulator